MELHQQVNSRRGLAPQQSVISASHMSRVIQSPSPLPPAASVRFSSRQFEQLPMSIRVTVAMVGVNVDREGEREEGSGTGRECGNPIAMTYPAAVESV